MKLAMHLNDLQLMLLAGLSWYHHHRQDWVDCLLLLLSLWLAVWCPVLQSRTQPATAPVEVEGWPMHMSNFQVMLFTVPEGWGTRGEGGAWGRGGGVEGVSMGEAPGSMGDQGGSMGGGGRGREQFDTGRFELVCCTCAYSVMYPFIPACTWIAEY